MYPLLKLSVKTNPIKLEENRDDTDNEIETEACQLRT